MPAPFGLRSTRAAREAHARCSLRPWCSLFPWRERVLRAACWPRVGRVEQWAWSSVVGVEQWAWSSGRGGVGQAGRVGAVGRWWPTCSGGRPRGHATLCHPGAAPEHPDALAERDGESQLAQQRRALGQGAIGGGVAEARAVERREQRLLERRRRREAERDGRLVALGVGVGDEPLLLHLGELPVALLRLGQHARMPLVLLVVLARVLWLGLRSGVGVGVGVGLGRVRATLTLVLPLTLTLLGSYLSIISCMCLRSEGYPNPNPNPNPNLARVVLVDHLLHVLALSLLRLVPARGHGRGKAHKARAQGQGQGAGPGPGQA